MKPVSLRCSCVVALMLCGLASVSPVCGGIAKVVTVTGMAAVYDGDTTAAFAAAKKSALRQAVEEALGVLISARTRVANFAVIDDDILSATKGYVLSYEVLSRGTKGNGAYEVVIEATVDLEDLHSQLDAMDLLMEEAGRPRLICVGGEYVLSETGTARVQWGVLCGGLVKQLASIDTDMFHVDDLPTIEGEFPGPGEHPGNRPAEIASAPLASGELAEILIVATASLQANKGLSVPFSDRGLDDFGIQSVVAELLARAQWSDTGETLASISSSGRGADTSFRIAATSAIAATVPEVAEQLGKALVENLRTKLYDGRLIKLELTYDSPTQLQTFESQMNERIAGVARLYPRARTQTAASYQARSTGTAFELSRELAFKGIPGMSVDIVRVTLNSITLHLSEVEEN